MCRGTDKAQRKLNINTSTGTEIVYSKHMLRGVAVMPVNRERLADYDVHSTVVHACECMGCVQGLVISCMHGQLVQTVIS